MFGRLLWKMLRSNRGRLAVALVAVISGATVISALLNLQFDIERKLTQEFSALGPNLAITAKGAAQTVAAGAPPALMDEAVVNDAIKRTGMNWNGVNIRPYGVGARPFPYTSVPYLYVIAKVRGVPVVVAGTDLNRADSVNPTWKIVKTMLDGEPVRGDWVWNSGACIVGKNVARQLDLHLGKLVEIDYLGRSVTLTVGGVGDSGAAEDDQIFADLATIQNLAGLKGQIQIEMIRVDPWASSVQAHAAALAAALPQYDVRPIRAVTQAEGILLDRTRLLIASMVVLILVLTALCVLATMMALAMERRKNVGLMKALGGSIARIMALFLAEVGVLGAVGGMIGCVAGVVLARWMGERVFGASITPRWDVFPLTIVLMVAVALAGALPLRLLGKVKPAVILRGE